MTKVFIVGIDSLDYALIQEFRDDLPTFRRLLAESGALRSRSVLPPDSATAWPSIYTGLDPAKHGMVYFIDPLDKVNATVNHVVDNSILRGRSFWDLASEAGRRVVVAFPHMGYPAWDVNGIMVVRDEKAHVIEATPRDLGERYGFQHLMVLQGLPTSIKALGEYAEKGRKLMRAEAEFTRALMAKEPWDLFFTYSSVMDWASHNFWNYHDPSDPSFAGEANPHRGVLRDFYKLYDSIIGDYFEALPEDAVLMVLSDHGHGLRPPRTFNLNEHLRRRGLFMLKGEDGGGSRKAAGGGHGGSSSARRAIDRARRAGATFVNSNRWTWNVAMKTIKHVPALRRLYTSPPSIDWDRTLAYTADQSGIKAYNYGGVMLNRKLLEGDAYEKLRDDIIADLHALTLPDNGGPLFRWVDRRETVYDGPYIGKYPDVCFEMAVGWGAGWNTEGGLFGHASAHNIQPGSHRRDTAVLLFGNLGAHRVVRELADLVDVAPTVLRLLGVRPPEGLDGASVVEPRESDPARG